MVWQMAEAFAAADDLENAEKALREALRLLPYNQAIYTKLADVCFRQGKLDEALRSLADLATYHENRQDLDKAIEILNNALKLAPGNITIGERLARLYIRRGYPDKGVEGLLRVAELQRKEGQIKDAVTSLQQAAEIRWMQGKQEETLSIYDRIVQVAPQDVEARQWRAIMYTLVSRTAEAIAEKKEIVNILAQRQDYDNAIAELHQIIGLNTNDLDAYYMLGDMLMRRGEYTQALNLYHRMNRMTDVETERVEALIAAAQRMIQNQQMSS
jgi:tetratricopeptide (TPR) repeat protein